MSATGEGCTSLRCNRRGRAAPRPGSGTWSDPGSRTPGSRRSPHRCCRRRGRPALSRAGPRVLATGPEGDRRVLAALVRVAFLCSIGIGLSCSQEELTAPSRTDQPSIKSIPPGGALYSPPIPTAEEIELLRRLRLFSGPLAWEPEYGSPLGQTDDDCDSVPLGFTFQFYGQNYTNLWVNSNGNLTFNGCNWEWWHPDIPDQANIIIGTLYGDFDPEVAGEVHYNVLGEAPYRRLIATWSAVPEYSQERDPNLPPSTFQVWLFEESNQIQFGYNGIGTDGFQWSYQAPSTDTRMEVGISSGTGLFKRSAIGAAIVGLDMTNICYEYIPETGLYREIAGPCELYDPDCPDFPWFRGKSLERLRDLWDKSNPVSQPGQDTSQTFEHGGWVLPDRIEEWTNLISACRVGPGQGQENPPPGAVTQVHTHPLAPTPSSNPYPGPLCGAGPNQAVDVDPGASRDDKNLTQKWSQDPNNPISQTFIIDHNGVIQVDPDGNQQRFDGCING